MKRKKERLYRVIVIGATPAGIAATIKVGELGVPVTLMDASPDLDEKFSREEWRLNSGVPLNYAHRPGLIRILRNRHIRSILPGRVTSLKHTPQGFRAIVKKIQTFIDPDLCTLCGRCFEICPVTTPDGRKPINFISRGSLPGRPVIEKSRQPSCQANCPLGVNAQAYIALTKTGDFRKALEIVRRDNILPGICGRVCTHPCEEVCRRGELDEPLAIRDIKRFIADYELAHPQHISLPPILPGRSEKIAIIGSGPAGLAASADLACLGYEVKVFEKETMAGGLLRYGIGQHRLPRDILDNELDYIRKLGVQFITSHPVDLPGDIEKFKHDFDAVILTTGCWSDRMQGVPGEELEGVEGCLGFLNRYYRGEIERLDEKVAVIGDGNAAFDLARTLRRIGAHVTILSWFPEEIIPADEDEIKGAGDEEIPIMDQVQVIYFSGQNGKLEKLHLRPTKPGVPDAQGIPWPMIIPGSDAVDLEFDRAIVAIGQSGPFKDASSSTGFNLTDRGFIDVDETASTNLTAVFAAGDAVTGPSSVVEAMASGRAVARFVHKKISGEEGQTTFALRPEEKDFPEIPAEIPSLARPKMPERQPAARCDNFLEVALGLNEAQITVEADRCLQCGICSECLLCTEVCAEIGAINHKELSEETIEQAGVVIIADPEAAPQIKGEDVIRAYGPKTAKPDVHAMITRGFAAASRAMALLGENSLSSKGHGVSFSPPDPELSPEIRVGVFVCRCNDSFGWLEGMDTYFEKLGEKDDIIHTEIMPAACIPEGSARILRAIREKGITRAVLASCVCCPLDFICSACTDQRSRLKDALFNGTGISRSMVETCNLRGEVLRHVKGNASAALNHFTGLMERSIQRARKLKPLPALARTYNFTTAVIGESEAAVNSANTLAAAGLEVFMFGTPEHPLSERLPHPNIHCFDNSVVRGMSGSLGNFQIFVELDGLSQVMQVGSVILGEKNRHLIPYNPQESLDSSIVASSMQKHNRPGIPFLFPGTTSIAGLFLANPPGINVSERKKGAAAAVLAAAIMPRGPRQSKGYTVTVDKIKCRGCGRCINVCPYQAITFHKNSVDGFFAVVDEALCKGCGNCISVCPSNVADSPYRDQTFLEQMLEEVLIQ